MIVAPLAVVFARSVYAAMLVKKDSPYKTGRDLNGKTIASPALRDLNWVASMAWIDQNGGDSSTVKSVEVPASVIPAALDDGRIDAATVTTPRYVQAVNGGKVRVLGKSYEAIAKHFAFAAIVAQADYANKNADVIAAFRPRDSRRDDVHEHAPRANARALRSIREDRSQGHRRTRRARRARRTSRRRTSCR